MPVVLREGINDAIREARRRTIDTWRPFTSLKRFIARYRPEDWREIQSCRMNYRVYEAQERPGFYKIAPYVCKRIPWCISCVQYERWRRATATLEKFYLCTPGGREPRFIHIVQTAPTGFEGAWGDVACRDVPGFARVVWRALQDLYGRGIGAVMSYHDFGERGLAQVHPHMDLTLNGWMLMGDGPEMTPRFELKGGGVARWHDAVTRRAQSLRLGATAGNVSVTRPITGAEAYYRILKYQMREIFDVRKLLYRPDEGAVYWCSYRDNRRERFAVADFLRLFDAYSWRLGLYEAGGRERLHRSFGHLSKRGFRRSAQAFGGQVPPHGSRCPCAGCGDWNRVVLDDVDAYQGPGLRVKG